MAELLKNHFGADVPATIAAMVVAVHADFPASAFIDDCLAGYEPLELMPRGRHIARALRRHLPPQYPRAIEILLASSTQPARRTVAPAMAAFLFMPHCFFVAEYGLNHFEPSMQALYQLTQLFSAEFSIRAFLLRHPRATLTRLRQWASDPNEHVRRLVSEGTRSRLPWAPRLPAFQSDPSPVLELLELLKDDPALYVRRSVANNLSDIGKDNPLALAQTARRWMADASEQREWLLRHAMRYALKHGEPWALALMGFGKAAKVVLGNAAITPRRARIGGSVTIAFDVHNCARRKQHLLVDFQVHFVKSSGATSAKVFKLKVLQLAAKETVHLRKKLSLANLTTRTHHAGKHVVEALINGAAMPLGSFSLMAA